MLTKPSGKETVNQDHFKNHNTVHNDMRCCCGKLLAKRDENSVTIRCPRCKKEMTINLSRVGQEFSRM